MCKLYAHSKEENCVLLYIRAFGEEHPTHPAVSKLQRALPMITHLNSHYAQVAQRSHDRRHTVGRAMVLGRKRES